MMFGIMKIEYSGRAGTPNVSAHRSMMPEVFTDPVELEKYRAANCHMGDTVSYAVVELVYQA